jgi:hypothetical protein
MILDMAGMPEDEAIAVLARMVELARAPVGLLMPRMTRLFRHWLYGSHV